MKIFNRVRTYSILLLISLSHLSNAQKVSMLDSIQGIWREIGVDEIESLYKIIRGSFSLGISISNAPNGLDIFLSESIIGFQNHSFEEVDSIDVKSLSGAGEYYTEVLNPRLKDRWAKVSDCNLTRFFEYHDNYMAIPVSRMAQYQRINRLPIEELKLLFEVGKRDKRDYIKEYLNLNVKEIKKQKETIYSSPDKATKIQLTHGDVVTIIEEKKGWLKIDYGADEPGWIKK